MKFRQINEARRIPQPKHSFDRGVRVQKKYDLGWYLTTFFDVALEKGEDPWRGEGDWEDVLDLTPEYIQAAYNVILPHIIRAKQEFQRKNPRGRMWNNVNPEDVATDLVHLLKNDGYGYAAGGELRADPNHKYYRHEDWNKRDESYREVAFHQLHDFAQNDVGRVLGKYFGNIKKAFPSSHPRTSLESEIKKDLYALFFQGKLPQKYHQSKREYVFVPKDEYVVIMTVTEGSRKIAYRKPMREHLAEVKVVTDHNGNITSARHKWRDIPVNKSPAQYKKMFSVYKSHSKY